MFRRSGSWLGNKLVPSAFFNNLVDRNHSAFFGVPDSLLKDFCAYVTDHVESHRHVITANEGNAVAMAAGYHMATGVIPVVYMQNSGVGNALNPLLSLTHAEVCRMPMLLLIGWRGDPHGKKDEPQHVAAGRLMPESLAAAEIPFSVLEPDEAIATHAEEALNAAAEHFERHNTPYAILIKRDSFDKYKLKTKEESETLPLTREEAIMTILNSIGERDLIVGTTGMPSREIFESRVKSGKAHNTDFLTVGSMGHASSIAVGTCLGLSPTDPRSVFAIDGDGAALMHLGAMAVNGSLGSTGALKHFKHIVVNNAAHDSVGGQPTVGHDCGLTEIAKACNYKLVRHCEVENKEDLITAVKELKEIEGPAFLEVHVRKGNRADLGRPTRTPESNKVSFMLSVKGA